MMEEHTPFWHALELAWCGDGALSLHSVRLLDAMQQMLDEGIATRRGVMNAHQEGAYPPETWRGAPHALGNSEEVSATSLVLPLFHEMTDLEQDRVVTALERACG